jgi:hypothetical protein
MSGGSKSAIVRGIMTPFTGSHVGFKVLTVVVVKSSNFWDIMPCSPLKIN